MVVQLLRHGGLISALWVGMRFGGGLRAMHLYTMPAKNSAIIVNKLTNGTPEILVYGYIDADMATDFAKQLKALETTCAVINVRINSGGGSVYDGVAMFNCIRTAKCAIDIYIDGIAASMASAIAMAGRKVYMSRFARIMTHKPSGYGGGSADELRATADEIDALEPILNELYCQKTGLDAKAVTAKFLNGKDNYFGADAAKAAGLIDGIYDGAEVAVPAGADIKAVYEAYQVKLTASLNDTTIVNDVNTNLNMRQIPLAVWAQICATMGITDSADDASVVAAIKKLTDKAGKHDVVAAKLKEAEEAAAELEKENKGNAITALLDQAMNGKVITAQQKAIYAADYAENPEGLKKVLAATPGFKSVTEVINRSAPARDGGEGEYTPEVVAMMKEGWDKLDRGDRLGELKAASEPAFNALYLAKYKCLPNASLETRKR